jgi:hypothetical protein
MAINSIGSGINAALNAHILPEVTVLGAASVAATIGVIALGLGVLYRKAFNG